MVRFSVLVFPDNVVLAGLVMDYGLGAATLMAKTSGELIWLVTQDWPCNTGLALQHNCLMGPREQSAQRNLNTLKDPL